MGGGCTVGVCPAGAWGCCTGALGGRFTTVPAGSTLGSPSCQMSRRKGYHGFTPEIDSEASLHKLVMLGSAVTMTVALFALRGSISYLIRGIGGIANAPVLARWHVDLQCLRAATLREIALCHGASIASTAAAPRVLGLDQLWRNREDDG